MVDPIHNGWTIARSAMLTHQQRLTVTANNIANVDTPGYSRREVLLATVQDTPSSLQEVRDYSSGVGVRVASVVRAQNPIIQNLIRQQTASSQGHQTRSNALSGLETLLATGTAGGLGTQLNAFWNSWYDLANQAENLALRNVVVLQGHALAQSLNSAHGSISNFEAQILGGVPGDFHGQLPSDVERFNQLTAELQDLNARISYSLSSFDPHGLMDRRETVLAELSGLANVTVGSDYAVALDGQVVVSGNGAQRAVLEVTGGGPPATFELYGTAVNVGQGVLGAWSDVLDVAAGMRDRLDTLAAALIDAVNSLHNSDRNPNGDTYDLQGERCDWDFFVGTGAADIAVNPIIYDASNPLSLDASLVAAASSRFDAGPPPVPNPGDGSIALQIADLSGQGLAALGGQTLGGYHAGGLTALGSMVRTEAALAKDGNAILSALQDALQSETGVNMDEELMNMLMGQRAYESAARLFRTFDELMQTLLQM